MKTNLTKSLIFIIDILLLQTYCIRGSIYCESYNDSTCTKKNSVNCFTREKCRTAGRDGHNHCFTLWEFNAETGASHVQLKGCFLNNKDCYEKSHCIQKNKDDINQLYFCCCNGNMCNQNFTYNQFLRENKDPLNLEISNLSKTQEQIFSLILSACVFFFVISITFISWYYRHRRCYYANELTKLERGENRARQQLTHQDQQQEASDETTWEPIPTLELLERKALGRFGAVWKARMAEETLAVKVFPLRDRQSWEMELEVFRLPGLEHEDLLRFMGAHRFGEGLDAEFWLLTAYHERGSLFEYLTNKVVTWDELYKITLSMVRGLNHLHQEIFPTGRARGGGYKPAVAHRDFKSKNILLRSDMRACVADFGLALVFGSEGNCNTNGQGRVGTLRYMAPEVLDGAINFTKEAFLAVDMYACGLVLWELASRCAIKQDLVSEYQLPFEKEVSFQPTLEEMQECVVQKKRRPHIPEMWKRHWGLSSICDTIEECWDHDSDARLSASCVLDRIASLREESESV